MKNYDSRNVKKYARERVQKIFILTRDKEKLRQSKMYAMTYNRIGDVLEWLMLLKR
jgi:hypothetical protein